MANMKNVPVSSFKVSNPRQQVTSMVATCTATKLSEKSLSEMPSSNSSSKQHIPLLSPPSPVRYHSQLKGLMLSQSAETSSQSAENMATSSSHTLQSPTSSASLVAGPGTLQSPTPSASLVAGPGPLQSPTSSGSLVAGPGPSHTLHSLTSSASLVAGPGPLQSPTSSGSLVAGPGPSHTLHSLTSSASLVAGPGPLQSPTSSGSLVAGPGPSHTLHSPTSSASLVAGPGPSQVSLVAGPGPSQVSLVAGPGPSHTQSPVASPVGNFPCSAIRSPTLFTILKKYLPYTCHRVAYSTTCSTGNVRRSEEEWLNEPDDVTASEVSIRQRKKRFAFLSDTPEPGRDKTLSSSKRSSDVIRPMDVAGMFLSTSGCASETTRKLKCTETVNKKGRVSKSGPSPNAFVSVRVSSPSIHQGLEVVQEAMVEKDEIVRSALTSLKKLHVTLSVICLEGEDEQERAKGTLLKATQMLNKALGLHKHPLTLTVSGLSSFGQSVVYADIVEEEILQKVADLVRTVFEGDGFPDVGGRSFNPHLTIAKMSLAQRRRGRGGGRRGRGRRRELKGLREELYADFKTTEFGVEKVLGIELLSMVHPPTKDKYYYCFQRHSFEEVSGGASGN